MGSNPSRTIGNRSYHDQMITVVACNLETSGYFIQADHVGWRNGAPASVNGHTPDVVAVMGNQRLILEVEDCLTYADQHTREQLTAFAQVPGCQVYVVIPSVCIGPDGNEFSMGPHMLLNLGLWELADKVRVALCDPHSGTVTY